MAEALLLELGVALSVLAVAGSVARYFDQPVIPAYIAAGILVGPHAPTSVATISLQLVSESAVVETAAEVGIVLLLFFLGLEFDVGTLVRNRRRLSAVGGIDLAVNAAVGVALGVAFGFGPIGVLLVTGVVYISSSAIVTKALTDAGWLANPESEVILGTLVVEDLVIAVYLAVVAAVVGGGGTVGSALTTVVQSFVFLTALAGAAHFGTEYVDRVFGTEADELFVLRVVGTTVLVGGAALSVGASEAVAAFFVGTAFHGTDLVHRVESLVVPVRDVFAALFFFAVGLGTDLLVVADVWLLLAVAVVATTAAKLASGYASGRVYGLDERRSARVGLGLVARGEFSLIVATLAATSANPTIRTVVPAFAVGYVIAMSFVGSLSVQYGATLSESFKNWRRGRESL
ncbi:cation:proton antiporter [Halobacterium sp. CBA1126]|uniref:cation:proton antiporter n=1 Tax=Halobacterium sp. CBA1126 TaxID=2668074 RepID=UPI0012F84C5B|nr:cation:proton antiporter [Halobacterium sp. CBA1126]MUV60627.1 cation:proton antiporter [Halobacterium sp. CBA1126]